VRGWWDADWPKRRRIDLALPENVAGPLSSVPVLILLDDQRIAFDELQANGEDLRFVDADDTTVLAHEIERWEPTGGTAVWVEIPEFTAVDSIFMYWGNPDAPAGDDPGALWSPGYAAVYHLDDNPEDDAPQIGDSSPSLRDATVQGGMTNDALVPGFATRGLAFDGMDDKALVGTIDSDAWTEITLSAWVFHGDEGDDRAISKAFGAGGSDHVFMLGAHSNDVKVRLRTDGDGAGTTEIRPAGSLPPNEWHYVAMTWSASTEEFVLFVDGNEVAREGRTGESLADANPDVYLANVDADENRHWLGTLDEIRIEYGVRDGDWFATQFAAMNDTLATFAAEEALP
jgi:biopolymer transport protein ExbB